MELERKGNPSIKIMDPRIIEEIIKNKDQVLAQDSFNVYKNTPILMIPVCEENHWTVGFVYKSNMFSVEPTKKNFK